MSFRELAFIARATLARLAAKSLSREDMNLLSAALNGMDDYALASLECGARIEARDGQGRGALHYAAQYGYASTLRLLLDSGANPDAIDHTPLPQDDFAARYFDKCLSNTMQGGSDGPPGAMALAEAVCSFISDTSLTEQQTRDIFEHISSEHTGRAGQPANLDELMTDGFEECCM